MAPQEGCGIGIQSDPPRGEDDEIGPEKSRGRPVSEERRMKTNDGARGSLHAAAAAAAPGAAGGSGGRDSGGAFGGPCVEYARCPDATRRLVVAVRACAACMMACFSPSLPVLPVEPVRRPRSVCGGNLAWGFGATTTAAAMRPGGPPSPSPVVVVRGRFVAATGDFLRSPR